MRKMWQGNAVETYIYCGGVCETMVVQYIDTYSQQQINYDSSSSVNKINSRYYILYRIYIVSIQSKYRNFTAKTSQFLLYTSYIYYIVSILECTELPPPTIIYYDNMWNRIGNRNYSSSYCYVVIYYNEFASHKLLPIIIIIIICLLEHVRARHTIPISK